MSFISTILDILVYAATGLVASWYFYHRRKKDLLGGFWGGAAIGVFGSVLIAFASGAWFIQLITFLMRPKPIFGGVSVRVNLIAAFIGAFLFVYILNRINHDRDR